MTFVSPAQDENSTLIDALLAEQRDLSAVERFARVYESNGLPAQAKYYKNLLPASVPSPGQQYAFEVDLDKCSGCKACVTACHSLNGLEENETWRSVGLLISKLEIRNPKSEITPKFEARSSDLRSRASFGLRTSDFGLLQHITTACHHCVDPACLNGCPVLAYEKDPLTGIVRHLDDQCIGCQYCILMCPYDVPKYSENLGIVRKCDMCANRLAVGEAPACVQACPSEAIRITLADTDTVKNRFRGSGREQDSTSLDDASTLGIGATSIARLEVRELSPAERCSTLGTNGSAESLVADDRTLAINSFLRASPNPAITLPATRYISAMPLPENATAGDAHEARLQPMHAPLVAMLVLTQLAAGGFALLPLSTRAAQTGLAFTALAALLLGLTASFLHLGQPLKAWRAFLGLRHSWLSREIVMFGAFASLAVATTIAVSVNVQVDWKPALLWSNALVGLFGVFCSGMIYHVTQRECWRGELSIGRFFNSTLILGLAAAWCVASVVGASAMGFAVALVMASLFKLSRALAFLRLCPDDAESNDEVPESPLVRSAFLMRFRLGLLLRSSLASAWLGGVTLPLVSLLTSSPARWLAFVAFILCVVGELAERTLFFRAVVAPKMPGGIAA